MIVGLTKVTNIFQMVNKYPRDFTCIPIFSPLSATEQMRQGRRVIKSAFGQFLIYGMATTTDEDVLIALVRLREYQINDPTFTFNQYDFMGNGVALNDLQKVHCLCCTYTQIENELDWKHGGRTRAYLKDSLRNLRALTIFFVSDNGSEQAVNLLNIQSKLMGNGDEYLQVTFPDWFIIELSTNYVFLNPNTRAKLSPLGKRIYGFFCGQGKVYQVTMKELKEAIGYEGTDRAFKVRLRESLDILKKNSHDRFIYRYQLYSGKSSKNGTFDTVEVIQRGATSNDMKLAKRRPLARRSRQRRSHHRGTQACAQGFATNGED